MNSNPQSPQERWEHWLDRELKALPDRPAPASLVPRVLTTIAARARLPWYRQPWSAWPRFAQVLALAMLSILFGTLTYACLHFPDLAAPDEVGARLNTWLAPWAALWNAVMALGDAAVVICNQSGGWLCAGLAAVCLTAYLSAVGAGTILYRLAFNHRGAKP